MPLQHGDGTKLKAARIIDLRDPTIERHYTVSGGGLTVRDWVET